MNNDKTVAIFFKENFICFFLQLGMGLFRIFHEFIFLGMREKVPHTGNTDFSMDADSSIARYKKGVGVSLMFTRGQKYVHLHKDRCVNALFLDP